MDPLKTASSTPEAKLHFLDYWRIIRIRKTVILAVFLLVVITAAFVSFMLPEIYASTASIQVQRESADVAPLGERQMQQGAYDPYFIQTQFEVIRSQLILHKVIDALNLNETWGKKYGQEGKLKTTESYGILAGMIDLKPTRNTSIIEIKVFSDDKNEAALIANTVAQVYHEHRKAEREQLTVGGIKVLTQELEKQEKKVQEAQEKVNKLRQDLNITETDLGNGSAAPLIESSVVQRYELGRIEAEQRYIAEEKVLSTLKTLDRENLRQTIPTVTPDGLLNLLLEQLITAESSLVTLKKDYGAQHPEVIKINDLVQELNEKIDKRVEGIMNGQGARVAALKAVMDKSEAAVEESKKKDREAAQSSSPYRVAKEDLASAKRLREILAMKIQSETVDKNIPVTTVTVINKAEPNDAPVKPKKGLNMILGVVVGLIVGVGLAFFIEYLDTSVKTIDDVERALQAPVLGVIPQNVGYLLEEGAESPHAEAYRVLRTNLLFTRKDDKLNTMAVVSAGAGEGKSTTVFNLATVFAQSGDRVLVVDSDLRRPTLHKHLKVANNIGLTNYLLKQNTLEQVIQTTSLATLDFLSSGKLPSSSLSILNSSQMKDLISELKQRYDFVFFDSPPIMGVSDASVLASEVDLTLQVIQYRRYPQPMNIRAKQTIEKVGGNLIGIVLNNINMSQDENYYYYSGYNHDYYSKNEDSEVATGANGTSEGKSRIDIKQKY